MVRRVLAMLGFYFRVVSSFVATLSLMVALAAVNVLNYALVFLVAAMGLCPVWTAFLFVVASQVAVMLLFAFGSFVRHRQFVVLAQLHRHGELLAGA